MHQINTALLSFGMSGRVFHAPFLEAHPGFKLSGAWERSSKTIQDIYPQVKSYTSLEEILKEEEIELVIVNTPNHTHFEYAKKALLAGKHVIAEKAFTTTVKEATELKTLADSLRRHLSVYHNRRWDSDFKTIQKIVNENVTGEIVEAAIHFDRYKPRLGIKQHKELPQPGAGLLNDLGPHIIDQAICLFGMPASLFADIRITREGSRVDDWFDITLYYPGFPVRLKAGFFVPEKLPGFIIRGKKGSFLKARSDVQENHLQQGKPVQDSDWGIEPVEASGRLFTEADGKIVQLIIPTLAGNYYGYYDAVYKSIQNNLPAPVTAQDGINVMKIIEAAIKSSNEKKVINL